MCEICGKVTVRTGLTTLNTSAIRPLAQST